MNDIVLYYACKYSGDWEKIHNAIKEQREVNLDKLEELKKQYEGEYITIYSPEYPLELRQINRPPFVLFYKGKRELLNKRSKLWMFGSYYESKTNELAKEQSDEMNNEGITLISGYSSEFERNFIQNIIPKGMIIVRDCGIDSHINMTRIEEASFLKNNIIISEHPDKVIPSLYSWEMSNRIKYGLTNKLYLLNSEREPITFKLISEAIDDRREIFCYEKDVTRRSHNTILISKGAHAVNEIKELSK